jgi:hypothetical protein
MKKRKKFEEMIAVGGGIEKEEASRILGGDCICHSGGQVVLAMYPSSYGCQCGSAPGEPQPPPENNACNFCLAAGGCNPPGPCGY